MGKEKNIQEKEKKNRGKVDSLLEKVENSTFLLAATSSELTTPDVEPTTFQKIECVY